MIITTDPDELKEQHMNFTRQHMRAELKEVAVKGEFERMREFLSHVLPGSKDTLEMQVLLEGAEICAIESIKNDVFDGL